MLISKYFSALKLDTFNGSIRVQEEKRESFELALMIWVCTVVSYICVFLFFICRVNVCGGQCCHGWTQAQGSHRCIKRKWTVNYFDSLHILLVQPTCFRHSNQLLFLWSCTVFLVSFSLSKILVGSILWSNQRWHELFCTSTLTWDNQAGFGNCLWLAPYTINLVQVAICFPVRSKEWSRDVLLAKILHVLVWSSLLKHLIIIDYSVGMSC